MREVAPFAKKWTSEIAENVYDLLPTEWTDFFLITNDQTGKILGEKAGNWAAVFCKLCAEAGLSAEGYSEGIRQ